ncbi:MAG TPA: hypothetical protein VF814_02260 [Casimicrobiaceae bacterium]
MLFLVAAAVSAAGGAAPVVLVDSTGEIAARPLIDTIVLVTDKSSGVVAPAVIRPIYGSDGRTASGLAAWQSGGSVLFTSPDCTTGAHVYSTANAGLRAAAQVQTREGIVLYVGAVGTTTTAAVRSILYDNGCSPVTVLQNGLVPVDVTVNLTARYPPPLSFE